MHIILTQDLALQSESNLSHDYGVLSMFQAPPLSTHGCNLEFKTTKSFKYDILVLSFISPRVQVNLHVLLERLLIM